MHVLIDVDTNRIIVYILTMDKIRDNTMFHMLTDMAFIEGHVFDTIHIDSTYEVKENWKDSEKQGYTLVVKSKSNYNEKSNGCITKGVTTREYLAIPNDE